MSVRWLNRYPEWCDHEAHWDVTQVKDLLASLPAGHDPVHVVAGRFHHSPDDVAWVRDQLQYPGVLIVTSDEESLFPWWELKDPNLKVWVMNPRPYHIELHGPPDMAVGEGYPPHAREHLRAAGYTPWRQREWDWFFGGQDTHARRHEAVKTMMGMIEDGAKAFVATSQEFAGGLPPDVYYEHLSQAKIAPAPSGPATPDSFRAYEAFMAGCVPVLDQLCPAYPRDDRYWRALTPDLGAPLGHWLIKHWDTELPKTVSSVLHAEQIAVPDWVAAPAWWSLYQHHLRSRLRADTRAPGGCQVTAVIPTSPIPSHPSTAVLEETVRSVRDRLPDAEILIVADGVRDEQRHLESRYHDYLHRVAWLCNVEWDRTALIVVPFHQHQALCLKQAMGHVDTPHVLMLEHDTPLQGDFNWDRMCRLLAHGEADLIRFLHESRVLPDYEHLMLGGVETPFGLRMRRTKQWSQRPHLATAAFYRHILGAYFGSESRTMVEDVMHGVVKNLIDLDELNWFRFRLWVLCEPDEHGSIQRSYHLDGRGSEPMFPNVFAYPGDTPEGAPAPTAGRVD